ncbi:MAG: Transcriptional regulatory protein CusR [Candidatus Parcubacteria bacterium]|jgi:DNA-binding response OmpR family regulator
MRVLIIEDHPDMAEALRHSLESERFAVDVANDGEQGLFMARTTPYDLILLDYVLPKRNGREVCLSLRSEGKTMPILFMSVKTEIPDKVDVLDVGADDYLVKPFSHQELLARVRALLRRPKPLQEEAFTCRDITLDARRYQVTRDQNPVHLTRKEFMILECLLRNQGSVVTRTALMEQVWDSEMDPFSNTLDTHILNLRKKIESPDKDRLIKTVPNLGYTIQPMAEES